MHPITLRDTHDQPILTPRVLLVEDNTIAQQLAIHQLKRRQCHIDLADCGRVALQFAETYRYHLMIMDIGLPDMLGTEVARVIKQGALNKNTPVVALSAHVEMDQKAQYQACGIEEIFIKPLLPDMALEMLTRFIPGYQAC